MTDTVESLRRERSRLEAMLQAAPDATVMVDADGRIRSVNEAVTTLLGYEPEELQGKHVSLLVPAQLRQVHEHHRERFMAHPQTRPMGVHADLIAITRAGEEVPVEISLAPVPLDGEVWVAAAIRDAGWRGRQAAQASFRERLAVTLHQDLELGSVLSEVADQILAHLGDLVSIALVADSGEVMEQVVLRHRDPARNDVLADVSGLRIPKGAGLTGQVWQHGQRVVLNDLDRRPEAIVDWVPGAQAFVASLAVRSILSLPIRSRGQIIGVLGVDRVVPRPNFTDDEVALLVDVADVCGLAVANSQLHAKVRDLASAAQASADHAERTAARLQATMDAQLDPHIVLDARRDPTGAIVDFRYTYANDAACAYNELPREQLIGMSALELLPGQATSGLLDAYRRVVEAGEPLILDDFFDEHEVKGTTRRYDIRAFKVADGLSFTWRDVTDRHEAARRVAESEELYRRLAENMADVVVVDDGTRVTWMSSSITENLGWLPEELVGRDLVEFLHPDDVAGVVALRAERAPTAASRFQCRLRAKDGTFPWFSIRSRPVLDEAGQPTMLRIASWRSIDDEVRARQAHDEVRARHEQLAGLRQQVAETLTRSELDVDRRLAEVTRVVLAEFADLVSLALVDREKDALIQSSIHHREPDKDADLGPLRGIVVGRADAAGGFAGKVWLSRRPIIMRDIDAAGFSSEVVPNAQPFFERYAIRSLVSVPMFAHGRVVGTFTVARDAERPNFEDDEIATIAELAETLGLAVANAQHYAEQVAAQEEFRLLAENAGDIVARIDSSGERVWVSESVRTHLGWTPEEYMAVPVADLIHPDDLRRIADVRDRALAEGQEMFRASEYRIRHKNGDWVWASSVSHAIGDGTRIVTIRVVDREMEMRLALEQSNAELNGFASAAAHDLRAPLRHVNGFLALLVESLDQDALDEEQRSHVAHIMAATSRMDELIRDLLAFSRLAQTSEHPSPTLVGDEVTAATSLLAGDIAGSGTTVSCDSGDVRILMAPARLRQVLQNLIGNAIVHRDRDRPQRVAIAATPRADGLTEIRVSDDGPGIDPAQHQAIFAVFKKLTSGTGTGLGLAIVRRVVEADGGTVWVESDGHRGATFGFTVPTAL